MTDASAATQVAAPAIDLPAALERVMGDRPMLQRVLGRFSLDYRDAGARLRAAHDAQDTPLAQRIAHTIKGAAAMIGAQRLHELALTLEQQLKDGTAAASQATQASFAQLDAELIRVLQQIDTLVDETPAPAPSAAPMLESDLARLRTMLDIGDGRAPELVQQGRSRLLATLGQARMHALETAVERFDFERALVLLEQRHTSLPRG